MSRGHADNARVIIAELARVSGLTFARPDRLSRDEAQAAIKWAQGNQIAMSAYRRGDAEAQAYADWMLMFAHDYPQTPGGEPVEWSEVSIEEGAGDPAAQADDYDPFKDFTADQAAERIGAAMSDPKYAEFRAAYADASHPDHKLAVQEYSRLHEIAYPEPSSGATRDPEPAATGGPSTPAQGSSSQPTGGGVTNRETALQRVLELEKQPALLDRHHPEHKQALDSLTAAYGVLYPDNPASADTVTLGEGEA